VIFFCVVIGVFAAVDLTECGGNYACFFINIMILVGCVFGCAGAWRMDSKLLGWFILLCLVYVAFEIGFIIWAFVKNYGARHLLWNFLLIAVLLITIGFARDLRGSRSVLSDGFTSMA